MTTTGKRLLQAWGMGFAAVLLLLILGNSGIASSLANTILSPGMFAAGALSFGVHDLESYIVALLVDTLLFGAGALLLFWTVNKMVSHSRRP